MTSKKGDGSIQQLGKNKWRVSMSLGMDQNTGKYRRVTKVVNGTKTQAKAVLDGIRSEVRAGVNVDSNITYGELYDLWETQKHAQGTANDDTIAKYRAQHERVFRRIGSMRVRDINVKTVNDLFSQLKKETSLSGNTRNRMFVVMQSVLDLGETLDIILRNPCRKTKAPKKDAQPDKRDYALSVEDCRLFMAKLDEAESEEYDERNRIEAEHAKNQPGRERGALRGINSLARIIGVRIGAVSGLRLGEVLALSWKSVDMRSGRLRVDYAMDQHGELKEPKTRKSRRPVYLDGITMQHLRRWKAYQKRYFAAIQVETGNDTPIVCSDVCSFDDKSNFDTWWNGYRSKLGFPNLNFHKLRHTSATRLMARCDPTTVQQRHGHSSASLTFDWYSHPDEERDMEAGRIMGEIMYGKPNDSASNVIEFKSA